MTSQRFCLRWNNHQTNLLAVFDQLLHDETFIDVTLAVEGQHLKAHKMVLSACSPYFQQLFVSHPEKHPIVILRDVPFKDMKCLLDFMYRGEVSVDQDRLAAFLRVAESLRIKGLTEVNDDKPNAPSGSASATATNSAGSAASSGAQATGATTTTNTVPNATVQKNSSGSSGMVAQVDDDEDDRCSPVPNSIAVAPNAASSGQAQGGHLKPLPPLLSSTGIVTRSHSNSLLQQGGSSAASGSAMVQTNPLLGTALSQQKRKRGRPRKLSGSDAGEGETEGNFVGGGGAPGEEYDSSSMDIMDVKIASSGASNSGDDDQQLRIVSSRTDDDDTLMHEKAEQLDDEDDEVMDDEADELVDDVDLEAGDEPRGTSPSLDESMEDTIGNMDGTTNNNGNTNRSGRQHQKQGTAAAKPSRASKRSRTRNNENSLSGIAMIPYQGSELSIFPINLEKKDHNTNAVATNPINGAEEEEESDEEIEFILPKAYCAKFSDEAALNPPESRDGDTLPPLLQELKRNGHLQDVTIIERRRSFDVPLVHQTANGTEDSPKEAKAPKLDETDNDEPSDLRVRATAQDTPISDAEAITELENRTDHINMLSGAFSAKPMRIPATAVTKRRTRHTISPNDPAKALTEMSVRGLDLFQYATINGGMYRCMECAKDGFEKTFKNKYSFQRHAFLYHEGKQRKVFPCTVCDKQFSRPDKMKNHLRLAHETAHETVHETAHETGHEANGESSLGVVNTGLCLQLSLSQDVRQEQQYHYQKLLEHHHARQQQELSSIKLLHEEQRRRQHEQDVMRIRSVVNALNLRQLQQMQQQNSQELDLRMAPSTGQQPDVPNHTVQLPTEQPSLPEKANESSVPIAQLIVLNGSIGSQLKRDGKRFAK